MVDQSAKRGIKRSILLPCGGYMNVGRLFVTVTVHCADRKDYGREPKLKRNLSSLRANISITATCAAASSATTAVCGMMFNNPVQVSTYGWAAGQRSTKVEKATCAAKFHLRAPMIRSQPRIKCVSE